MLNLPIEVNGYVSEDIRKELVRTATSLFIKKGYRNTTTRELAAAFGKSNGGLYYYVESKKQMLGLVLDYIVNDLDKSLVKMEEIPPQTNATEALVKAIKSYSESMYELQDMQIFIEHVVVEISTEENKILYAAGRKTISHFEHLLYKGIKMGEFKIDDPKLIAFMITHLITGWPNRRWFLTQHYTYDKYVQEVINIILTLIKTKD